MKPYLLRNPNLLRRALPEAAKQDALARLAALNAAHLWGAPESVRSYLATGRASLRAEADRALALALFNLRGAVPARVEWAALCACQAAVCRPRFRSWEQSERERYQRDRSHIAARAIGWAVEALELRGEPRERTEPALLRAMLAL